MYREVAQGKVPHGGGGGMLNASQWDEEEWGRGERHDREEMREQDKSEMEGNKGSEEERERGEREVGGGFNPGGSTESHTLAVMGRGARGGGEDLCGTIQEVQPRQEYVQIPLFYLLHTNTGQPAFATPPRPQNPWTRPPRTPRPPGEPRRNRQNMQTPYRKFPEVTDGSFRLLRVLGT